MKFILTAIFACFFAIAASSTAFSEELVPETKDSVAELQSLQNTLNQMGSDLSAEDQKRKQALLSHIDFIKRYDSLKAEYNKTMNDVKNADAEINRLKSSILTMTSTFEQEKAQIAYLDNSELSEKLSHYQTLQIDSEQHYEENRITLEKMTSLPETLRDTASDLDTKIDEAKRALAKSGTSQEEAAALKQQIKYYQHSLSYQQFLGLSRNKLMDLAQAKQDYYKAISEHNEEMLLLVSKRIEDLSIAEQNAEYNKFREETANIVLNDQTNTNAAAYLIEDNNKFKALIDEADARISALSAEENRITSALSKTNDIEDAVSADENISHGSLIISQKLENQKLLIPEFEPAIKVDEQLNANRLELYDVSVKIDQFDDRTKTLEKIIGSRKDKYTEEQTAAINEILSVREKILQRYLEKLITESNLLANIKMKIGLYEKSVKTINSMVNKKLFWLQSTPPIDRVWFKSLPLSIKKEIQDTKFYFDASDLWSNLLANAHKLAALLLFSLLVLEFRKKISARIEECNKAVGSYRKDSFLNTPLAFALTFLRHSNWACWSIITGLVLDMMTIKIGVYEVGDIARVNNGRVALLVLLICFYVFGIGEKGMSHNHFIGPCKVNEPTRRSIIIILATLIAISLGCSSKEMFSFTISVDIVGEIILLAIMFIMFFFGFLSLKKSFKQKDIGMVGKMLMIFCTIMPIAIIIMLADGYYYSAIKVLGKCIDTFVILIAATFVFCIALRSIKISTMRMEYKRRIEEKMKNRHLSAAQGSHAAESDERADLIDIEDDELMQVSEISQQSMRIVVLLTVTALVGVLYFVWQDIIVALGQLHEVTLWTVSENVAAGQSVITKSISLADLFVALYTFFITIITLRNLPGLLEMFVLNKFSTSKSANYSIKTVFSYIILAFGMSFGLSRLGISWDKLQWLVAALSVGIGFGLQEIVANFISGIIILFERPIRIGDVITIDSTTGVVTKIRTRATTIMDFDKKDLIVPNKTFITSKLTNWSLNDVCLSRLCISVDVGYGSDIKLVQDTLMIIAERNEFIAKSPKPYVVFNSFGESNLNFQLMVYISKLSDMTPAKHSLNSEIYNEFNRLGIEIAFNQLDVYIKNTKTGEEVMVKSSKDDEK